MGRSSSFIKKVVNHFPISTYLYEPQTNKTMKTLSSLLFTLGILLCLPAFSQSNFDWGFTSGATKRDEVTDIAMDAQGNVYLTGAFQDSMNMANGGPAEYMYGPGFRDIFLAKYDATGAKQWAFSIGNLAWDRGWSMTLDNQANVYAGGVFSRKADFDPGPDSTILTSNPAGFWPDGYLAKYSTNGELQWAKHLLTARNRSASQTATLLSITGMEIDNNGDLVIGGAFWDTVWLAPNQMIVSDGALADMFIAKYDADGNFIWAKQMGGSGDQRIQSLSTDPQGNIYTTGFFFGSPYFDAPGGTTVSTQGSEDIFLAKYNSSGALLWAQGFGSVNGSPTSTESGLDVGTDDMGNVYFTGRLLGAADFDPNTAAGSLMPTTSGSASFFAKLDGGGTLQWVYTHDALGYHLGKRLAVQPNGDFWLAGEFGVGVPQGGLDLDPGPDTAAVFALGGPEDIFIAKYDRDAAFQTGWSVRGLSGSEVEGLAANATALAIGGYFDRSLLLDRQSGTLRSSRGAEDCFVIKYGEANMAIENALSSLDFSLYPNPIRRLINLKFSLQEAQRLSFSLYTMEGTRVLSFDQDKIFSPGQHLLHWELAERLTPGRYLLSVTSAQGQQLLPVLLVE
jgi:hypothetical protein